MKSSVPMTAGHRNRVFMRLSLGDSEICQLWQTIAGKQHCRLDRDGQLQPRGHD